MIHDCLFGGYDEAPPPMAPEAALRMDTSLRYGNDDGLRSMRRDGQSVQS